MIRLFSRWALGLAWACALAALAGAETVTLPADQDTTLYQNFDDSGNGGGEYFFSGVNSNGAVKRGLIRFDTSVLPPGTQIDSVAVKLTLSRFAGSTPTIGLHKITESWTEGGTNSQGQEGAPDLASPGDATWRFRSFGTTLEWSTLGGSFVSAPSATLSIPGSAATYTWNSTAALVADVQGWVNTPASNFGWMVKAESESGRRARRWNSRTNGSSPPQLVITFTPVPFFADGFETGNTSAWGVTTP